MDGRKKSHQGKGKGPSEERKRQYLRETFCMSGRARGLAALWWERIGPLGTQVQGPCPDPTSVAGGRVPISPGRPHPNPLHLLGSDDRLLTFPFGCCFVTSLSSWPPLLEDCPQLCSLTSQFKCDQPQHSAREVSRAKAVPLDLLPLHG